MRVCRPDLDPTVTVERVTRTDARVICCGHTHIAETRELGRKLIVNPGSCGYSLRRRPECRLGAADHPRRARTRPTPTTKMDDEPMDMAMPEAQLFRAKYDFDAAAEEVSARGLPGDVYRAATIRMGRLIR